MIEVLADLRRWWQAGESVAVASVVATLHSAPLPAGTAMLIGPGGRAVGSLSGGCVEGAIYEAGQEVRSSGQARLESYSSADDDAIGLGLPCGGGIDVFVERVSQREFPELGGVFDDVDAGRPVAIATVIEHPDPTIRGLRVITRAAGTTSSEKAHRCPSLHGTMQSAALRLLDMGRSGVAECGLSGEPDGRGCRVFVRSIMPPPRMLIFGAVDFAAALAQQGSLLGYRVTVCDARPVFATKERFVGADEVVVAWPHVYLAQEIERGRLDDRTVVCVLTHDMKFDVPLLRHALKHQRFAYVGAMGSRRTHLDRLRRLTAAGVTDRELTALSSPIGLDLGARTPAETAVSIAAEIIAVRAGGTGERLREGHGPIHRDPTTTDPKEAGVHDQQPHVS